MLGKFGANLKSAYRFVLSDSEDSEEVMFGQKLNPGVKKEKPKSTEAEIKKP